MWSAVIWLLLLVGSTIAQYGQQMHVKSRPVQKDIHSTYGVGSSRHIPPSKRKYFPAPDVPRPDFKYSKNRKRIVAHNRYQFRNNALDAFMRSNARVKFTIHNLGPYPNYGPFSRKSLGYNAKFKGKQKQNLYTGQEAGADAYTSGCENADSAVLATHSQARTLKHSVAAPCVVPSASLPSDYGSYGKPEGSRNNHDGSEVSETKYETSGGSQEGYEQPEGIEDNNELQKANKGSYEESEVSEESYEKSQISENKQKESEGEEDGYEGQEDSEGDYEVQEVREEKHKKQRGKQVKYGERRGNENKAGGTGGYEEETKAKLPSASALGHTETAPDTLSGQEQTEELSSYDGDSESASRTETGLEKEEVSATQKPAISSYDGGDESVIDKAVTQKQQKGSTSNKIIPPTGKGTHLGPSKKTDKFHPKPPSLRPPKANITVSGSKKKILSSLCSSDKKTLCVTESTSTTPAESREEVLSKTTEASVASTVVFGSQGDVLSEFDNETSPFSQTSNTSVLITSEQSYENTNEILTETRTGSCNLALSTSAQAANNCEMMNLTEQKRINEKLEEGATSSPVVHTTGAQISESLGRDALSKYIDPPIYVPIRTGTRSNTSKSTNTSNIHFEYGKHRMHSLPDATRLPMDEDEKAEVNVQEQLFPPTVAPSTSLSTTNEPVMPRLPSRLTSFNTEEEISESNGTSMALLNSSTNIMNTSTFDSQQLSSSNQSQFEHKFTFTESASYMLLPQEAGSSEILYSTFAPTSNVLNSEEDDYSSEYIDMTGSTFASTTDVNDGYDQIKFVPEAAQSGIVGPDGRLAGKEREDGYNGSSQPGFGPTKVKLSTAASILPQPATSIVPTAAQAVTPNYSNTAIIPSVPPLVPALPSIPAIPFPSEIPLPSASTPIPAPASISPVPGPQPESFPAPLPVAQVPYLPSENTLESSQYIPAPPPAAGEPESLPASAPASVLQLALSSTLLPRPGGAVPYATTPSFLLPTPEATITPASQVPIPLPTNARLPISPAPRAPVPTLPQAGPSPLPTPYQPKGLTETVGIFPARPSVYEKNTTLLMTFSGSAFSSNTSTESAASKFEAGNQMKSGAVVGLQQLPYGEEVKASEQIHENYGLSRGEGPQPLEPVGNGEAARGEEEYYDSETEAPPEQNIAIPTRDRITEQKVWSQIEGGAYGEIPKETHVQVSSSAPVLLPAATTPKYLPNAGSSYRGTFDKGIHNGGFTANLGTAQGGQQFVGVNSNFGSGGNVGSSSSIVGRTPGGVYPGPAVTSFGDQSAVLGYSQASFAYGGQPFQGQAFSGQPFQGQPFGGRPFQGQAFGGQPLGVQQNLLHSGAGEDGCCGGNWLSQSGGFCSPINFSPCVLPTLCRCCCCCCPGSDCSPSQPLCQSSCVSSCCQSANSCARRRKRTTALGYLGLCR